MIPGSRRAVTVVLTVVGCALVLAGCDGSGARSGPSSTPSGAATSTTPPSASRTPEVTLPPSVANLLPTLPSGLGGADPCAHASTAFTAASAYLALAQLGQASLAQKCVQGDGVPARTTAALRAASVTQYFVPSGATDGTTIDFRRVDGTVTAAITLTRSVDHYVVTAVTVS